MILPEAQAMERDELLQLRREGGAWLRSMREEAGLSQRELAMAVGADYYSFVSQLESGRGRVPVAQVELWAKALKVRRSDFAKGLLKYYDPLTYDMLFNDGDGSAEAARVDGPASPSDQVVTTFATAHVPSKPGAGSQFRPAKTVAAGDDDLRARLNRIEAILMMRGAGL